MSENIKNISIALNKVVSEIKDVAKNSNGYGYRYATLDEVLKAVRPLCAKYGISIIQSQNINKETGFVEINTMLLHTSGEYIVTKVESPYEKLKGMNDYQSTGASVTYLRRYGLSMALGVSSEEDTDTNTNTNTTNTNTSLDGLKQLGIEIEEKDGWQKAVETKKGAIYQNKELLKKLGFSFNKNKKIWVKKVS